MLLVKIHSFKAQYPFSFYPLNFIHSLLTLKAKVHERSSVLSAFRMKVMSWYIRGTQHYHTENAAQSFNKAAVSRCLIGSLTSNVTPPSLKYLFRFHKHRKVLKLKQNLQPPAQALILKSFLFNKSEPESRIFFFLWLSFFFWIKINVIWFWLQIMNHIKNFKSTILFFLRPNFRPINTLIWNRSPSFH